MLGLRNLTRYLDWNSLVTRILVLFVIFNIISIFVFTFFIFQQDRLRMYQNVEESIREIAIEKAEVISLTMDHVANEVENLAMWTMIYMDITTNLDLPAEYIRNKEGVLYRKFNRGVNGENESCIFFPANNLLTPEQIRVINATQQLDPFFNKMYERADFYQWSYVATEDGLLRIFPYSDIDMFEPDHQQSGDPFYVVANKENNPERKNVWTKPYVDYMGTGWMITCSSPLYQGREFLGVACIDVRLDTLKNSFLADFRLSDTGFAYLLDNEGGIIYYPDFLPEAKAQGELLLTNILEDTSISSQYKSALNEMLSDGEVGTVSYYDESGPRRRKLIAYAPIEEQGWTLAVEIDYDNYMAVTTIETSNLLMYFLMSSVILLFFTIFLFRHFSKPITALRNEANNIAEGNYSFIESPSNLTEIKALSNAFNTMSGEIRTFTGSLIQKNKQIESIFNSIGGLLMIISPEYVIKSINERGKVAFEDSNNELVGSNCFNSLLNCDRPCKDCKVHEVLNTKLQAYSIMAIKDEIISNAYFPILNEEKDVLEVVVYSQRITKSVLMEKELLQTEKLAGIGQISSAIAHELKNPLAVIKGASYLLDAYTKDQADPRVEEVIQTISSTIDSAEKIIYNLLDYSSYGKKNMEWIDITKVVNQIMFLSNRERIQKNISTTMSFTPDPLLFYGQIEPLKNILQNVITNAITALSEEGNLIIAGHYMDNEQNKLVLTVEDDGSGIPEDNLGNVFKPFFTTDTTGRGTGLGLWITKMMVEKMEGYLSIETKEGTGTKVTVWLPVLEDKKGIENGI